MSCAPRVITIRYVSSVPYEERRHDEERLRSSLRSALGDILVRFEPVPAHEADNTTRVRFTGAWDALSRGAALRALVRLTALSQAA